MYTREKLFIMSFVAFLYKKGIKTLYFNNNFYLQGIENMQQYFQENRETIGEFSNDIAMLFLKNSNGEYAQFNSAIENLNAGLLTFDNPYYICAHIKEDTDAEMILTENNDDMPSNIIEGFVNAFCNAIAN